MQEKIKQIEELATKELQNAKDLNILNELRVKYLGKKGELTSILRSMGSLPQEERPIIGELVNKTRDKIEEKIIMGLRMNDGIIFKDFEEFGINFEEKYKEQLKKHESLDLITKTNKGFKFTQKGREISNNIFLDYID